MSIVLAKYMIEMHAVYNIVTWKTCVFETLHICDKSQLVFEHNADYVLRNV